MESAEKIVGIVTAASQALECWFAVGDPSVAHRTAACARQEALAAPEVSREASDLSGAVASAVLDVVSDGVARHWRAYEAALDGDLTREQSQAIHFALLACLNKELEHLRPLEGELPPGVMRRWWVEYS